MFFSNVSNFDRRSKIIISFLFRETFPKNLRKKFPDSVHHSPTNHQEPSPVILKNIDEIMEILMANEELKKLMTVKNADLVYRGYVFKSITSFRDQFNREPKQDADDLKWLIEESIEQLKTVKL